MRFEKFINESVTIGTTTYTEKQVNEILKSWPKVVKESKDFLKELKLRNKDNLMYRGSNRSRDFGRKKVRTDRSPKDMPIQAHDALDDAFKDLYGWRARSEGLFCTGRKSTASSYGTAQIVFPIGRYEYLWSDNITDLYSYTDDGASVIQEDPDDYEVNSWNDDWETEYGENNDGYWYYEGTQLAQDQDDSIEMIRDSEVESIESDIEYTEKQEEPDEDELADLKERLRYVKSRNYEYDMSRELTWEPGMDWDDYRDSRYEDWRENATGSQDAAESIIRNEYDDSNLLKALRHNSGTEIMVKCKEYFFFHHSYEDIILHLLFDSDYDPRQMSFDFIVSNKGRK